MPAVPDFIPGDPPSEADGRTVYTGPALMPAPILSQWIFLMSIYLSRNMNRLAGNRVVVDTRAAAPNNPSMAAPEVVRRIKSYSAESGYVYQYFFREVQKAEHGARPGTQYTYMVSADRKTQFPVRIFVCRDAVEKWNRATGRELNGTEEYAAAKMRLFQAFDEVALLAHPAPDLEVDETNLDALLERLGL